MKTTAACAVVTLLLGLLLGPSCSDVVTYPVSTFTVHGTATTGTHTRTPISGGYVALIMPAPKKWMRLNFAANSEVPNKAVTGPDGTYTFTIDLSAFSKTDFPLFLAVSDASLSYTQIAEIPRDSAVAEAIFQLDITPVSTAAAQLICPGGVYPPPSGAYCYSDPNKASSTKSSLEAVIEASLAGAYSALSLGSPPSWPSFMASLLSDDNTFSQLTSIAAAAGITTTPSKGWSATAISSGVKALPIVTAPIASDSNSSTPDSTDDTSSCSCSCDNGTNCTDKPSGFCGKDSDGIPNACGCPIGGGCNGRGHRQ